MQLKLKHDKEYYNKVIDVVGNLLDEENYTLEEILYGIALLCDVKSNNGFTEDVKKQWKYNAKLLRQLISELKECI